MSNIMINWSDLLNTDNTIEGMRVRDRFREFLAGIESKFIPPITQMSTKFQVEKRISWLKRLLRDCSDYEIEILQAIKLFLQHHLDKENPSANNPNEAWRNHTNQWRSNAKLVLDYLEVNYGSPLDELAPSVVKIEKKIPLRAIALKLHYEGRAVTRGNADEIVKQYGYTSGEKLYKHFIFYSSRANRKGLEDTLTKNQNKLKLFDVVIEQLEHNPQALQKATDEKNTLKSAIQSDS